MSLRRNVLASLASQVYVTLIGIALLPLYVRYMGAEAYGLVGFFAMLQSWFNLLDAGLGPTLAREAARQRGGAIDALTYRRLVRSLELVFLATAVVVGVGLTASAGFFATSWLRVETLPPSEVVGALQLMGPVFALRWMAGLYRAALSGAEQLAWLGGFNAAVATLRFAGVLPLLMYVGATPTLFFAYQLAIACVEVAWLLASAYRHLPASPVRARLGWDWQPLRTVWRFALSVALATVVGVLIMHTDKLVLSRVLPLSEYAYFMLAVLAASGITILSGPIGNAVMPRLARLEAEAAHNQLIEVYRQTTQLVAAIAGTAAVTMALRAESLLWAWSGNVELASRGAPLLALYALGNGVLALAGFPYYLQYAKGDLRLHLIGNVAFVIVFAPVVTWASLVHGAMGAAWTWLGINLLSLVAWLPLVHRKFQPGLNRRWYLQDTTAIVAAAALAGYATSSALPDTGSRGLQFLCAAMVALAGLAASTLASPALRMHALRWASTRHSPP